MKVSEIGAFGWKVKKIVSKGHYNYAVVKEHPHATKHGYVLHHRVVMENNLGRLLNPDEVVYNINCSRKCSGTLSRDIQLNGVTSKVERAISENIVREYLKYSLDNSEETIDNGIRRGHTPAI